MCYTICAIPYVRFMEFVAKGIFVFNSAATINLVYLLQSNMNYAWYSDTAIWRFTAYNYAFKGSGEVNTINYVSILRAAVYTTAYRSQRRQI